MKNELFPFVFLGKATQLPSILRPIITYKIKLPRNKKTVNTTLVNEIEVPKGKAFKFQIELYSESMSDFKPPNKYALDLKFGFNNDIAKILLNSESDYDKLQYVFLS